MLINKLYFVNNIAKILVFNAIIIMGDKMQLVKINKQIFREYDIRAIYNEDFNEDVAYTIGRSFGTYIKGREQYKVLVGHDNRSSSLSMSEALIKGITDSGMNVIDLGLVTTPMYYFARKYFNIAAGIMVTASHNPKEYNGFKLAFDDFGNAFGAMIEDFRMFTDKLEFDTGHGEVVKYDIKEPYINNIKESINLGDKQIKAVIDCGNGTASTIIRDVFSRFNVDTEYLYCDSDPEFPNHIPDPAVGANMVDLGNKVKELKYDIGIGIDGDADRVGITDEQGKFISADLIMLMIYRDIVPNMKNKKALFDVKCSKALIEGVEKLGLEPVMNRTGNSYCNKKMQDGDFDFGGEYSGHVYFRDRYQGFDDGIYAALRIIEILSKTEKSVSELLKDVPKYYSTEEIKIEVREDNKFKIIDALEQYVVAKGYKYENIDGIRAEFENGWALMRASNTGPNLTVRFEAKTRDELENIKEEFMEEIDKQKDLLS